MEYINRISKHREYMNIILQKQNKYVRKYSHIYLVPFTSKFIFIIYMAIFMRPSEPAE